MKLLSWNVNGIRAVLGKGFLDMINAQNPDIICLQETKASPEQVQLTLPGYQQFWNSAEKKGYSGTAIFAKHPPLSVSNDMGMEEHDKEGRVIAAEFADFHLVNVYTPNSQRGLTRLKYRQQWDKDFRAFVAKLNKEKPVIFCGDLNVAHKEIDLKNPKQNERNAGFTEEEREGFSKHLDAGFVDSFRHFNQEANNYTWWSYMFNARAKNIGWRIDYFCVSEEMKRRMHSAEILANTQGSDHCPVVLNLK